MTAAGRSRRRRRGRPGRADLDEPGASLLDGDRGAPAPARRVARRRPTPPLAPGLVADRPPASTRSSTPSWPAATSTTPPAGCAPEGEGFYTIGSAGHEANALVAAALRPTDPALLHYRSGGFYLARAQQVAGHDGVGDVLLGLLASADEPIAGGRHKVFGHHDLASIPQTSTIASHLPRAIGVAFAIGRAAPPRRADPLARRRHRRVPASATPRSTTPRPRARSTPPRTRRTRACRCRCCSCARTTGWGSACRRPAGLGRGVAGRATGLRYEQVDGTDPVGVLRRRRGARRRTSATPAEPAVLHLRTVRYGGHAGTDVEAAYRTAAGIRADLARDPLLGDGRGVLVDAGLADAGRARRPLPGGARRRCERRPPS